jgi:hypothetical protein
VEGARWVQQELLGKHGDADLRVYAVWFSMYPTDRRENWPADVLTDSRVRHYWDEDKTVGRWYMQRISSMAAARAPESSGLAGDILWDAYLVYEASSRWDEVPSGLRRWGRTVLRAQESLREAFTAVTATAVSFR